jgi:OOP family OmpA-OmpF porin
MRSKILILLLLNWSLGFGQIVDPKETAKRKAEDRTNRGIDRTLDKGLDKVEEGIGSIFKKKNKEEKPKEDKKSSTKKDKNSPKETETIEEDAENSADTKKSAPAKASLQSYTKFDFIPGEKVIGSEDFMQDAVGDFPAKWNSNGSGEISTIQGVQGHWLALSSKGVFYPEFIEDLPENTTIEFDMAVSDDFSEMQSGLKVFMVKKDARNTLFDQFFSKDAQATVIIHPYGASNGGYSKFIAFDKNGQPLVDNQAALTNWKASEINRISIWKQKTRYRMYINETKIWDIPRAIDPTVQYQLLFATYPWTGSIYISNLRVAAGAPDTRNKLITEGKFVTRGITFDVNSDKIKPESYGVIKEIATVLQENSGIRVKIVGHTDSDGDDKSNLTLSQKRAASVKNFLTSEFKIDAERLETEGKGESEPSEPNTTPQGKANNRRVEFIKL